MIKMIFNLSSSKIAQVFPLSRYFLFFLLLSLPYVVVSQPRMVIPNDKVTKLKIIVINNQIFLPVKFNETPMLLLLDTGVTNLTLFGNKIEAENELKNIEKVRVNGIGQGSSFDALKSDDNHLEFDNGVAIENITAYIIDDINFNLSDYIGVTVNGIIGYEFFKDYPIEIDYVRETIYIYNNSNKFNRKIKRAKELPFRFINRKPYAFVSLYSEKVTEESLMLLDLGFGDSVILFSENLANTFDEQISIQSYLGSGLLGEINGEIQRIKSLSISDFNIKYPIISIPDRESIKNFTIPPYIKGLIGGGIFHRFNIFMDYPNSKFYLKRNRQFKEPFNVNMSGLSIKHVGSKWKKEAISVPIGFSKDKDNNFSVSHAIQYNLKLLPIYVVFGVRQDSPAYEAGIRDKDVIVSINGRNVSNYSLDEVYGILKSKDAKRIRMRVERDGEVYNYQFHLKDPIPYTKP